MNMNKKISIISIMLVCILIFSVGCSKAKDEGTVNDDTSTIVDDASDKDTVKDDSDKDTTKDDSNKDTAKDDEQILDAVKVVDIKDLRTFVISVEDQTVDVALLGTGLPFTIPEGKELDNFTKEHIDILKKEYVGKELLSEPLGFDSTDRPLVYLWTVDSGGKPDKLVNEKLIGDGIIAFADFGDEVMLYKDVMEKAEKHAMDNGIGMWKAPKEDKK